MVWYRNSQCVSVDLYWPTTLCLTLTDPWANYNSQLKLYNTCILSIFLYVSEWWAVTERDVLKNQMVPSRAEWRGETENRASTPVGYCPSTASFSVRPYCKNSRRDRCQEYHNCFTFRELEETTRTSSNYVDEDYPATPEDQQSLPGQAITVAQNRPLWRLMSAFGATHP